MSRIPVDQLIARLGKARPGPREKYLRWNCPFCVNPAVAVTLKPRPDTSQCLFVSLQPRGGFGCLRCGAHGSRTRLLEMLGLVEGLTPLVCDTDYDALKAQIWSAGRKQHEEMREIAYQLPPTVPIVDGSEAMEYLRQRGISPHTVQAYGLCLGNGSYVDPENPAARPVSVRGRIVIPDDPVETHYWVARNYRADAKGPKYKNPRGEKGSTIFFLRRTPPHRVVLVEGSFDAITGGPDCAALLTKDISWAQMGKLLLRNPERVYAALDGEARAEQEALCSELASWGLPVWDIRLPHKSDASAIGRRGFRRLVAEAQPWNRYA